MNTKDQKTTLDEVILSLPPSHRDAIVSLKKKSAELQDRNNHLRERVDSQDKEIRDLRLALDIRKVPLVQMISAVDSLNDLLQAARDEHETKINQLRREYAERKKEFNASSLDAESKLAQTSLRETVRGLKPLQNYDYIDLSSLIDSIRTDNAPSSEVLSNYIKNFIKVIDGVRECTDDKRSACMCKDPMVQAELRGIFDASRRIEEMLGKASSYSMPVLKTVSTDSTDITYIRGLENEAHMSVITECGLISTKTDEEIKSLEKQLMLVAKLPESFKSYDALITETRSYIENSTYNEERIVEGWTAAANKIKHEREALKDRYERRSKDIKAELNKRNELMNEIKDIFSRCVDIHSKVKDLYGDSCQDELEILKFSKREYELGRAAEEKIQYQAEFRKGAYYTLHIASAAKELFNNLYMGMKDMINQRLLFCKEKKQECQEQLNRLAENYYDIILRRIESDNNQFKVHQQELDLINRSLPNLYHSASEMDRAMSSIRSLTSVLAVTKERMQANQTDADAVKHLLEQFQNISFSKLTSTFNNFESRRKNERVKTKLTDLTQRVKLLSDAMSEVSDPESRQERTISNCLELTRQTLADAVEVIAYGENIADIADTQNLFLSRLRRGHGLINHLVKQLSDDDDLFTREPALGSSAKELIDRLSKIIKQLAREDYTGPGTAKIMGEPDIRRRIDPGRDLIKQRIGELVKPEEQFADVLQTVQTFANCSKKLKISHDQRRATKIPTGLEMSNASALGKNGFRADTGIYRFTIKVGNCCSRLLIGFADQNLPLEGYCNSIKYPGCYYLHLGNGTLYAPEQRVERKLYTLEALSATGTIIHCLINTNEKTIAFMLNDKNLGVAFSSVNINTRLFPAFEFFSDDCSVEFLNHGELDREVARIIV